MSKEQILIACAFGVAACLVYGLLRALLGGGESGRLRDRLEKNRPNPRPSAGDALFNAVLRQIGQTAGKPFEPRGREAQSALRRELGYAGIYSPNAARMMVGARVLLAVGGAVVGYLVGILARNPMLYCAFLGLLGYMLPRLWLRMKIRVQRRELEHGLPDALDLMVVCVESGLTLMAAMQRVGQEIALAHPEFARELAIAHMEGQMGVPRAEALRNLGQRTGSVPIQSLSAMIIQAERFGTGIAQALRVHAEGLRLKRRYLAEERAAKAAVKLTFPVVFLFFPAVLIVLGGPAVISIVESPLFKK